MVVTTHCIAVTTHCMVITTHCLVVTTHCMVVTTLVITLTEILFLLILAAVLTFRHRASSIKDRRFATLQRTPFIYLIKYISLPDIFLTVHH
jgi:hypothetical protein